MRAFIVSLKNAIIVTYLFLSTYFKTIKYTNVLVDLFRFSKYRSGFVLSTKRVPSLFNIYSFEPFLLPKG